MKAILLAALIGSLAISVSAQEPELVIEQELSPGIEWRSGDRVPVGTVTAGGGLVANIVVRNAGDAPLTGLHVDLPRPLLLVSLLRRLPYSLAPGEEAYFTIGMVDSHTFAFEVPITILSNDPDESRVSLTLSARSQTAELVVLNQQGGMELSNQVVNMGNLKVGDMITRTFTLYNPGLEPLSLSAVFDYAGDSPQHLTILTLPGGAAVISPGQKLPLTIQFKPVNVSSQEPHLKLTSNPGWPPK